MTCQANYYGDCLGAVNLQKVLYKYVDSWGTDLPAEIIPIEMCTFHYNWLLEANTGKMPEMAGEFVDHATDTILFAPFRAFRYAHNNTTWQLQVQAQQAEQKKQQQAQAEQAEQKQAEQQQEQAQQAQQQQAQAEQAQQEQAQAQQAEQAQAQAQQAEQKQKQDKLFEDFEECLYFIDSEIRGYNPGWTNDEEHDNVESKQKLYKLFLELTEALLTDDVRTIRHLKLNGLLNNKLLLLVTYVMANHELFSSTDKEKKRNMVNNVRLVELFIEAGLQKELLRLAISGERQRDLSIHRRDESNVLEPNLFVVQFLVPKYIGAHEKAIFDPDTEQIAPMTPLEYWHDFSNHMWYIGDYWMQNSGKGLSFEKDEDIRAYLEKMAIFAC
jgi:hypothetical protein